MSREGEDDSNRLRRRGFARQFATLVDPQRPQDEAADTELSTAEAWGVPSQPPFIESHRRRTRLVVLALILAVAAGLRFDGIGRLSYGYDEVVSITLARAGGLRATLRRLLESDEIRAPLHPLLLHVWASIFGFTETASRSLSAACGVLTVALIYRMARRPFPGEATALWAAWLVAISPILLVHARETRMDSCLVLATCVAWDALFALGGSRRPASWGGLAWYACALAAVVYAHPLGLPMAAALALASALNARAYGLDVTRWLSAHIGAALLIAPCLCLYLGHAPDLVVGRVPLRFLFSIPIGFTGGNLLTLAPMLALVALGLVSIRKRGDGRGPGVDTSWANVALLIWLVVPPVLIWGYSRISQPTLGPARSMLFVAPAYLMLLAHGIARLPRWLGALAGLGVSALVFSALPTLVYAPGLKADWRAMAAQLALRDPNATEPVLVVSSDPDKNREIVPARYYLGPNRPVVALPCPVSEIVALRRAPTRRLWLAIGTRDGTLIAEVPPDLALRRDAATLDVPGLRLIAIDLDK